MTTSVKRIHTKYDAIVKTVTSTLTTIGDYNVSDLETVALEFANNGVLLDQFVISVQFYNGGAFHTLRSVAADYTAPTGIFVEASGDLTAIADAVTGWFVLYCKGIFGIRVEAASSGADTIITANGGGS